ncbi:MAG: methyl-accepting chemotaxis protein, partial [Bdellovibrionota bacterium]
MEISPSRLKKNIPVPPAGASAKGKDLPKLDSNTIHQLMDNVPVNVLFADLNGTIVYANAKSIETLRTIEDDLPIPVDEIVGSSYDVFHKNPSHQKRLLANPRNLPHSAVINVGKEKLELKASAVYDAAGNYVGPMVSWAIVTDKLKTELEVSRMFSMMENAPVNIMMCDLNFTITYVNPKSRETLRRIEKLLPIPVDRIVGSSIDVFHKAPDHQRRLLSDPRNLPHRAKIKVGTDTLDLMASPIYDKDKNYLGPMVTWDIITAKLELMVALEQTSQQLGAAAEELSSVSTQMAKNSTMTSDRSNAAAANSEEVSKGVQSVSANTEEMVASIKEIAKSSSEAAGISKDAMQKASETNQTINQLGEASQEIGNVIKVISSIAQQTNLLALNATIEAARAGDAGKGFAVVANEVKELAKQTAKATEDITNRIAAIQESSKGAVVAIGGISKVIEQINGISMTIAAAVEEQTATTNEVSRVVQESNTKEMIFGIPRLIEFIS